ncbi:retrovirus-related pol polyprotein from transposon TNT 1-94 [Tanacetum coccineum]|uniref:Retrovirus-related pol polyprotein from transposon TNT 1-94 n=1 Tax=Tanacetum coccineum TaxID=301880 RepID=A0ABQ5J040_9ASTR
MLKMVLETPLQFGVAERLSRTFRAESMGLRAEAPKMLWADSVSTTYLIHRIPYVPIGLRILEEEWQGKDTSLANLKVFGCDSFVKVKDVYGEAMKCTFIGNGLDEMRYNFMDIKSHQVIRNIPENLAENDSRVAEHGLSSEITQSLGGTLDTSEGSKNSGSFKDSGRSDKEDSEDRAFFEEGGSKTPRNDKPVSYLEALSDKEFVQWKKAINEEMVSLEKNQTFSLLQEPSYVGALNDTSTQHKRQGFSASWPERKPRVQIEGNYVRTDSSIEATMKDRCSEKQVLGYVLTVGITTVEYTKSLIHLAKNLKVYSWAKLVRILISEGSLSLLKILGRRALQ